MMRVLVRIIVFFLGLWLVSCAKEDKRLPILGFTKIENGDTLYHRIPDFSFWNQDSLKITNRTFADKAYVTDFFFISCPTICPQLTKAMARIQDAFREDDRLLLLSHTIDTKRDTIPRLHSYAEKIGAIKGKWHFVTGDQDSILTIANDYFNVALKDDEAPGGFDHSGKLILVDRHGHVRAFGEGTIEEEVDGLIADIKQLLEQEYSEK